MLHAGYQQPCGGAEQTPHFHTWEQGWRIWLTLSGISVRRSNCEISHLFALHHRMFRSTVKRPHASCVTKTLPKLAWPVSQWVEELCNYSLPPWFYNSHIVPLWMCMSLSSIYIKATVYLTAVEVGFLLSLLTFWINKNWDILCFTSNVLYARSFETCVCLCLLFPTCLEYVDSVLCLANSPQNKQPGHF